MHRCLPFVILSAAFLSACNIAGAELNTTIEPDGSGQIEFGLGVRPDEGEGESAAPECTADDSWPGATARTEQRGDEAWCFVQAPTGSLGELREFYTSLFEDAARIHCLTLDDERLIYDVEIVPDEPLEQSSDGTAAYWTVIAPGVIDSTNAGSVEGNRYIWSIAGPDDTLRFRINAPEGEACPTSMVRLTLFVNDDGTGTARLQVPQRGNDDLDAALAAGLQTGGWSVEFADTHLEARRTWESEEAFAALLGSIPGLAGDLTLTLTEDEVTRQRAFDLRGRLDFSRWPESWQDPTAEDRAAPFFLDYIPAGTVETVSGGWTTPAPLTLVYAGEGPASIPLRAVSVLQPELEVVMDPESTAALIDELSEGFVREIPVGQVQMNPSLIQSVLGVVFAPGTVNNMTNWTTFACGDYQTRVIQWLDAMRVDPDPAVRARLAGIDYGPIQAYQGGHQAVVVFPRGTDWRETGTVFDPWPNQRPEVWTMKRWTDRFTWGVGVGEGAGQYPHLIGLPSHYAGTEIPRERLHPRRIAVNSPVAALVVAADGRRVGMLANGEFVYEIDGADFYPTPRGNGEYQWYFGLPEGSYKLQLTGTGNGDVHVLVGDEQGQLVTYGPQAIRQAETALLEVDPLGIQAPLALPRMEAAPLVVSNDNAASLDFGEPLPEASGRPAALARAIYLGLLGLVCLVPAGAILAIVTFGTTRRGVR
jgi:hypothetical protein